MKWILIVSSITIAFSACGGSTDPGGGTGGAGTGGGGTGGGGTGGGGTGGSPSYDVCSASSDCIVRSASCCGQCGAATREDMVAIAKAQASDYATAVCGSSYGCPACYMAQDARLIATCEAGHCKVVDLAAHDATSCSQASDCRIRTNVCCECGGPIDVEHLVAIANDGEAAFSSLVCDAGQGCPECAPTYPPEVTATCASGHCEAVWSQ